MLWLLLACSPGRSGRPIVVWWTVDTLGARAAAETGWCDRMTLLAGQRGLDVACLDGAVAPSSWTGESHTRALWPQHLADPLRAAITPTCGTKSSLETIARAANGAWLVGVDNPIFGFAPAPCGDANPWTATADDAFLPTGPPDDATDELPVDHAIDDLLDRAGRGESVSALLDTFEAGGHIPRCYFDPDNLACATLWNIAQEAGLASGDPETTWKDDAFFLNLTTAAAARLSTAELRQLYWDTTLDRIAAFRGSKFDVRLERLLDGLAAEGRLADLELVVAGDHGENPCVDDGTGFVNCVHGEQPTEWTAEVPVFVVPARHAAAWEADALVGPGPWALANVSYGLVADRGLAVPSDWPAPMAVGTASSWYCKDDVAGISVVGDRALRCTKDGCVATTWGWPDSLAYAPAPARADGLDDAVKDACE